MTTPPTTQPYPSCAEMAEPLTTLSDYAMAGYPLVQMVALYRIYRSVKMV